MSPPRRDGGSGSSAGIGRARMRCGPGSLGRVSGTDITGPYRPGDGRAKFSGRGQMSSADVEVRAIAGPVAEDFGPEVPHVEGDDGAGPHGPVTPRRGVHVALAAQLDRP